MPLSATSAETSAVRVASGHQQGGAGLDQHLGGMRLTRRSSSSSMPTILAASAGRRVRGATQAVQLASWPGYCWMRETNWAAAS
jgi:hypothetical protein